jgi:hypothetical protein
LILKADQPASTESIFTAPLQRVTVGLENHQKMNLRFDCCQYMCKQIVTKEVQIDKTIFVALGGLLI